MAGGAAPPVATLVRTGKGCLASAGACTSMLSTIGAPQMWVMRCATMASKMRLGSTLRRHTCVPPVAVTPQVNVQPEQWNIGSVHR